VSGPSDFAIWAELGWRRLCPIRFAVRPVSGPPKANAPELDDRGWHMARPDGWTETAAVGPMVGMTAGDQVMVNVVRHGIAPDAPLYVTAAAGGSAIEISKPRSGPLDDKGNFWIKAREATQDAAQAVEVRLGGASGPVLGELEVRVFAPLTLRMHVHLCTIHGPEKQRGTPPDPKQFDAALEVARAVWRPAGIVLEEVGRDTVEVSFPQADYPRWSKDVTKGGERQLVAQKHQQKVLNVYVTRYMQMSTGVAYHRDNMSDRDWTRPALILAAEGSVDDMGRETRLIEPERRRAQIVGTTFAHELGHFLTLRHVLQDGAPEKFTEKDLGKYERRDIYGLRQLMHPEEVSVPTASQIGIRRQQNQGVPVADQVPPYPLEYRVHMGSHVVSYGEGIRGALLTLKAFEYTRYDGEVDQARRRIQDGPY
jgi:hypothetical protein